MLSWPKSRSIAAIPQALCASGCMRCLARAPAGDVDRCGVLIYTATAGAQGTNGGLVGTAPRFAHILRRALGRLRICSNDPVCADHDPDDRSGDRATHGSLCHSSLLV